MNKEQIELNLLLPTVPDEGDACVDRMVELLATKVGIDAAHIVKSSDAQPNQVCIHYDPQLVSIGEVRELATRVGVELDQRYGHWLAQTSPMHGRRASAIESRLNRIEGVLEAVVSPDGSVRVEFDRHRTNQSAIADVFQE